LLAEFPHHTMTRVKRN